MPRRSPFVICHQQSSACNEPPRSPRGPLRAPEAVQTLPRRPPSARPLPLPLRLTARRLALQPTRQVLTVSVAAQSMTWWARRPAQPPRAPHLLYTVQRVYRISTSAFGTGQVMHSNRTPLGLHRVARKIGGGLPIGTVFRSRRPVGLLWKGLPAAPIVHRILWLEGLEPGFNRGRSVDTFRRYIYIHGFGDELTLGHPCSHGCIHVAAADLLPLFDRLPEGTWLWIEV